MGIFKNQLKNRFKVINPKWDKKSKNNIAQYLFIHNDIFLSELELAKIAQIINNSIFTQYPGLNLIYKYLIELD